MEKSSEVDVGASPSIQQKYNLYIVRYLPPQMASSAAAAQSMKKTIGHRGVETTTGETTYKKVGTPIHTNTPTQIDRHVCVSRNTYPLLPC